MKAGRKKGFKMSEESKEKIRLHNLANPRKYWLGKKRPEVKEFFTTKGRKHTEEWKEAARKRMIGNKHGFQKGVATRKGKKASEETREKLRKSHLGKIPWNKGKKGIHSKETLQKNREWHVNNPVKKFKDTSIELKVEQELILRGINYQKQVPLCKVAIVDFYLPEYRIVIQCDGCYWHSCQEHGKGGKKGSVEKDLRQNAVLTFNGFNVYRFWEHDINTDVAKCLDQLKIMI